jgi:hypothetical protein
MQTYTCTMFYMHDIWCASVIFIRGEISSLDNQKYGNVNLTKEIFLDKNCTKSPYLRKNN